MLNNCESNEFFNKCENFGRLSVPGPINLFVYFCWTRKQAEGKNLNGHIFETMHEEW